MGNFNLFGIGPLELFFIIAIALIVLGPERLPQVAREVLKFIGQLRSLYQDLTSQLNNEFGDLTELQELRRDLQELNTDRLLGALEEDEKTESGEAKKSSAKAGQKTNRKSAAAKATGGKSATAQAKSTKEKETTSKAASSSPPKSGQTQPRTDGANSATDERPETEEKEASETTADQGERPEPAAATEPADASAPELTSKDPTPKEDPPASASPQKENATSQENGATGGSDTPDRIQSSPVSAADEQKNGEATEAIEPQTPEPENRIAPPDVDQQESAANQTPATGEDGKPAPPPAPAPDSTPNSAQEQA